MEKKQIIFALKIFLASALLGIFAGFLGVNPLGISQGQVIVALYSIFLGLGLSAAFLLLIVLGIWAGAYCLKITSKIRNYKLSVTATPKEVLDYLDTYDEGEKQAEMEEAYLILFKVNQILIPGIYVVLVVLSLVLGQVQLVALLVAVVIHLYTNVAQLRKTKRYFK